MAQQTNLNVSPYFDDFDPNDNYHKVLFKPGYPVQARELTGLQSILQNQIERFGQHFFKEGAKVIPGNTAYSRTYYALELNNTHLGVPVEYYIEQLKDRKIIGLTSGVTAFVKDILVSSDSERGNLTLYLSYLSSGVQDSELKEFLDGELLAADVDVVSGPLNNPFIPIGESFASTITSNCNSTGAAFSISNGVYFVRGNFVNVADETIILSQYSNNPTGRVGLRVLEEIINSDIDETLTDNSKGFNNFASPGADRLKISCSLTFKSIDDLNDSDFVELATVRDGALESQVKNTQYSIIADELARRTYAESGDYTVEPFNISIRDSLNDGISNNGIYEEGKFTQSGSLASKDLALYEIGVGKAFVKGYEVETINTTYLDVEKPRTTKTLENQGIIYNTGATFKVNNSFGIPVTGIGNTYVVSLRDQRVGFNSLSAPGTEIGLARVYDYALESGSYSATNDRINQWDLQLYDIQTFTNIAVNEPITLTVPTFVKGKYSGATGFLRSAVSNGTALTVYETTGDFVQAEPLIFDGIDNSRVAVAVTSFGIKDVKSVYGGGDLGAIGSAVTFSADTILEPIVTIGIATITPVAGATGVSTVISSPTFLSKVKVNDVLRYTNTSTDVDVPTLSRVSGVGLTAVTIVGIETVSGVANGNLPASSILSVTDLSIVGTKLSAETEDLDAKALYTTMPKQLISDVDLTNAELRIRKTFTVNISGQQLSSVVAAGTNETFLPFDEERYTLIRSDGRTVELTSDKFVFTNGSRELQINNIGSDDTGATLHATLKKQKIKEKVKRKNRINTVTVDKSKIEGSGSTSNGTLNNGLSFGNFPFGSRVEDEKISLNTPDVLEVLGVYESRNTSAPSAPRMTLSALSSFGGKTSDLTIGETIVGKTSGAIAYYAEKVSDSVISYIPRNAINFQEGEIVTFEESNITAILTTLNSPSNAISGNFTFNTGQRASIYGTGFIKRKSDAKAPTRQLKIYFASAYYDSQDDGDITTKNSYNSFDYDTDIQSVNGERNTDLIDIRPRVSNYTVAADTRSPLEFLGRQFNGSGNSAANILASDESINVDFSFYLGRMDRIFITKEGKFQVQQGTPSETYEKPVKIDDALEIATIRLHPYLLDTTEDSSISFLDHKRYRMSDIKLLEDRIRSLEYYTTLSLLEVNTENLFVTDSDGLNRFKSGFFVDDFTTLLPQESDIAIKNSIDDANRELRPRHFTNSIDLTIEPVEGVTTQTDIKFTPPEGENIKRMGDVITLDYEEVEWLKQGFATRTESITPFLVSFWQASIELSPASDTWVDTARVEAKVINVEGNYAVEMAKATRQFGAPDPQTGFFPIQWGSWETNWTGRETRTRTQTRTQTRGGGGGRRTVHRSRTLHGGGGWRLRRVNTSVSTTTTIQDTLTDTWRTGTDTRSGERTIITERFDRESQGDRVINREVISIMRSRNVEFTAKKARPLSRMYAFFDGRDVTRYCVPKLLEIAMTSGVFQVGETVIGKMKDIGLGNASIASPEIKFRVAAANHREGPFNAPTQIFKNNPYLSQVSPTEVETFLGNPGQVQVPGQANVLPDSYSSTSTVLNVDTAALALQAQGDYYGYVAKDMVLVGQTSGAQATVSNLRLQTDLGANLIGSFFIPNPNIGSNPRFETGSKTFTLIDNDENDQNNASSIGEQKYTATGTLETVQEQILSVRNAEIQVKQESQRRSAREFLGTQVASNVIDSVTTVDQTIIWWDPLAQSFQVLDATGVFITSCDVFFQTKDDMDIPMTFQIRTMQNGVPTQKILPFSEIVKDPDEINISQDGTVPTTFEFKAPVYLEPGGEYAITLASWSTKYRVFISRVGESDILTDEFISNQPYLGSLFKSQNASTWEPSQWEDLKFTIRRADFVPNGSLEIYSPILGEGNGQIPTLQPNSLSYNSKKVRVGLGSTLQIGEELALGNLFSQQTTTATGRFVGAAGSATGDLTLVNAGVGYTPDSGTTVYPNLTFTNVTGTGQDLTAEVTISNGVAVAATVTNSGKGYVVGDVLQLPAVGSIAAGRNARFSVAGIAATSELILDNVQGDFQVGAAKTLRFTNADGNTFALNATSGGNVVPTSITDVGEHNGLHFTINHKNHGMYHENNRVIVSNAESDITPTKLTSPYAADSTASIFVDDESDFGTFENIGVAATVPGFIKIGDEIIQYTSTASGELSGITRSVDGTTAQNYVVGTPVYKYETGGVSLRRINKTHLLSDTDTTISNPITYDSYTIKVDMANNGFDRSNQDSFPKLYFNDTKSTGGYKIKATQNMPFEAIVPQVQNLTVPGTTVSARIRTTSGSNLGDGSGTTLPVPFQDEGIQEVTLNATNYLDSPRIIASRVNETNNSVLQDLPGDRSFNMSVTLRSEDSRLTPVIDTERISAILISNRVDSPISNFIEDNRVNTIDEDPTAFQYISKENTLESSATSIKILLSAHINEYTDIRAFYAIGNEQDFEPIFQAFPGYASLNDGTSDRKVPPSNASEGFDSADLTFKEYEFTIDDLPSFKSYRIKLVSTSTNQAYAPRIRDLRTIALA